MAVIYSHDHGDHYGGASAVVSPADAASGKVKVIAPDDFMRAVDRGSVGRDQSGGRAGPVSVRRRPLPVGERGIVDYGEGEIVARGPAGAGPIIPPNDSITKPFESRTIDGVTFEFQLALDTEAPSEMFVYLPQAHVLDMGEDAYPYVAQSSAHSRHVVRNALSWSQALNTALDRFGGDVQILINQHQWPVWGNARARTHRAENHRDLYKYIHDQTLRMMNEGMAPARDCRRADHAAGAGEGLVAAAAITARCPRTRMRSISAIRVGMTAIRPISIRLPPVEEAKKQVEYMGGADAAIARAREDFKAGNYRWVAQVMDQVVFADPSNKEARALAADAFEQMGYCAETAPWRNSYLLAAQKLRGATRATAQRVFIPPSSPQSSACDAGRARCSIISAPASTARARARQKIVIAWRFTDTKESAGVHLGAWRADLEPGERQPMPTPMRT